MKELKEVVQALNTDLNSLDVPYDTSVKSKVNFENSLKIVFEKAVKDIRENDFAAFKGKVSRILHPDMRQSNANDSAFINNLRTVNSTEIQNLPIQTFNAVYDFEKTLRTVKRSPNGDLSKKIREIVVLLSHLKKDRFDATENDKAQTDAHNLELLKKARDSLNSPFFNSLIDILYQYHRYPDVLETVVYYLTAVINGLLILGTVPGILAIELSVKIVEYLRTLVEKLYLTQFDESLKRKAYVHFGKQEAINKGQNPADGTVLSDDCYANLGKRYIRDTLVVKITEKKLNDYIQNETEISLTEENCVAIGKDLYEITSIYGAHNLNLEDENESDRNTVYLQICDSYLQTLAFMTCKCSNRSPDIRHKFKINKGLSVNDFAEVMSVIMKPLLQDNDYPEESMLAACKKQMRDEDLTHLGYALSYLFEELTKPFGPDDNLFITGFLRILWLSWALPMVMLVTFPLSLATALFVGIQAASCLVAVGIKLLSAVVLALPLYVYDGIAWAARCGQPDPAANKDRCFDFAAMGIFKMIRDYGSPQLSSERQNSYSRI